MDLGTVVVSLCSGLLGSLIGAGVAAWALWTMERRKLKFDLARRLAAHRYDLRGSEFSAALNEVIVTFADSKVVLEKLQAFYLAIRTPQPNPALVDLLKAVFEAAGLNQKVLNDEYLLTAFNVRQ